MTIIHMYKILKAFNRKIREDSISAFSAMAAFFVIISFFPFIMLLQLSNYLIYNYKHILYNINLFYKVKSLYLQNINIRIYADTDRMC